MCPSGHQLPFLFCFSDGDDGDTCVSFHCHVLRYSPCPFTLPLYVLKSLLAASCAVVNDYFEMLASKRLQVLFPSQPKNALLDVLSSCCAPFLCACTREPKGGMKGQLIGSFRGPPVVACRPRQIAALLRGHLRSRRRRPRRVRAQ